MRVFENGKKVNFVDQNNVFLGYDLSQCCCESAGWFITTAPSPLTTNPETEVTDPKVLEPFVFDTVYRLMVVPTSENCLYEGGMVVFRLVNGSETLYLHIYNSHNGYYGHGFVFKIGETLLEEGGI